MSGTRFTGSVAFGLGALLVGGMIAFVGYEFAGFLASFMDFG